MQNDHLMTTELIDPYIHKKLAARRFFDIKIERRGIRLARYASYSVLESTSELDIMQRWQIFDYLDNRTVAHVTFRRQLHVSAPLRRRTVEKMGYIPVLRLLARER